MKIAVLLATYNSGEWLHEQLSSIFEQIEVDLHVFVSDDLSTDGTIDSINKLGRENVTVLPPDGKFGSAAQNFFRLLRDINFSGFNYVAFSDQDDIWLPDKLIHSVNMLDAYQADGYSSSVIAIWKNGKRNLIKKDHPLCSYDFLFGSPGPGCTHLFTAELASKFSKLLQDNRGLASKIAFHDWLIYAFARSNGFKWFIDSKPTLLYRQHETNEFGANFGLKAYYRRWQRIQSGWYFSQILLIATILGLDSKWPVRLLVRYSKIDRIKLILNIVKFRRSWSDRLVLMFIFIFISKNLLDKSLKQNIRI